MASASASHENWIGNFQVVLVIYLCILPVYSLLLQYQEMYLLSEIGEVTEVS